MTTFLNVQVVQYELILKFTHSWIWFGRWFLFNHFLISPYSSIVHSFLLLSSGVVRDTDQLWMTTLSRLSQIFRVGTLSTGSWSWSTWEMDTRSSSSDLTSAVTITTHVEVELVLCSRRFWRTRVVCDAAFRYLRGPKTGPSVRPSVNPSNGPSAISPRRGRRPVDSFRAAAASIKSG